MFEFRDSGHTFIVSETNAFYICRMGKEGKVNESRSGRDEGE